MRITGTKLALIAALLLPCAGRAQVLNSVLQFNWVPTTGSGAPSGACTSANYGQPYVNITPNPYVNYTCGPAGWVQISGGGGGTSVFVNGVSITNPNFQNYTGSSTGGINFIQSGSNIQAALASTAVTTSSYLAAAQCQGGVAFATGLAVYDNNAPQLGCYNASASTAAYLAFQAAPSLPQYAEATTSLPAFWTSTDITVLYTAASATSGTFILEVQTACPASTGSTPGSPTFGTASTATVTVPGTAGNQGTASITGIAASGVNSCPTAATSPSQMIYRVFRSASDTATGNININGVILATHRSQ